MKGYTYKIINNVDGKFYVGSSVDINKRWKRHLSELRNNLHHNINLQQAYNTCNRDAFELEIVYEGILYQQKEQDLLDNTDQGILYNICKGVHGGDTYTNNPNLDDIRKRTSDTLKYLRSLEGEGNPWKDMDFRGELNPNWKGGISADYDLIWDKCVCGEDKKRVSALCYNCHVNSRQGSKNPFFGKTHSEEAKEKIRKARSEDINNIGWVKVSIEGVVFNNKSEAARHYQVSRGTVTHRCKSINFPDWIYL